MPEAVNIRFKKAGPIYSFDPAGFELEIGDWVIVDTARGQSMGKVISAPIQIPKNASEEPLKPVVRKAEPEDFAKAEELAATQDETLQKCAELIKTHELPMKAILAEYNFDGSRLTIYFSAENKVDFRTLLKELGSIFKTRVELRQVGARDVAKLLGGTGRCGRTLCCSTHLSRFEPISVRMARDQDLSLNPAMISGICGKLLCCLKYEHDQYVAVKKKIPGSGKNVMTPNGPGRVIKINALKETVNTQLENGPPAVFKISDLKPGNQGEKRK